MCAVAGCWPELAKNGVHGVDSEKWLFAANSADGAQSSCKKTNKGPKVQFHNGIGVFSLAVCFKVECG